MHLIDPVPRHVEEASRDTEDGPAPETACLGDARSIGHEDGSFDAALLLGPLYHLTERPDRMTALAEARRVIGGGGVVAARGSPDSPRRSTASTGDSRRPGLRRPDDRDLADGQHRNTTGNPLYFTTAFFHHPDELRDELAEAGFFDVEVYAVEGVSWAAPDLADRLADPARREIVLEIVRRTETDPPCWEPAPTCWRWAGRRAPPHPLCPLRGHSPPPQGGREDNPTGC